jgi:glycosyltransferase involved in cell wall biosynthesis
MSNPLISVIMPVFKAEKFLKETMDSVLNQSLENFEFLIIDDCSPDNSYEILTGYKDKRIRCYRNEINLGYVKTLNILINLSNTKYLARQDNDDVSHPDRLMKQYQLMENNLEIGLCGTNARVFGSTNQVTILPIGDQDLRAFMIYTNPFIHSSVMIRKSALENESLTYNVDYCPSEDYLLWFQISKKYKIANLPEILLYYRTHEVNYSKLNKDVQITKANEVRKEILKFSLALDEKEFHSNLNSYLNNTSDSVINVLKKIESYMLEIIDSNQRLNYYNKISLQESLFNFWTHLMKFNNQNRKFQKFYLYFNSKLFSLNFFIRLIYEKVIKRTIWKLG